MNSRGSVYCWCGCRKPGSERRLGARCPRRGRSVCAWQLVPVAGAARRARRAAVLSLDQTAADFCARHDFRASPTDPLHMVLLLKDARA